MKKRKRMKKLGGIISFIILLALVMAVLAACGGKKEEEPMTTKVASAHVEPETEPEETDFTFVFFGIDDYGYATWDLLRSDIIMVMNIVPEEKKINLVSILRDTKVPIEGLEGTQRINAAYREGGPELALKTINENFGTNFTDYMTMDFQDPILLIDSIGGIDVEISDIEAETINSMVWLDMAQDGRNQYCVDVYGGLAHLDGTQALMFSRIRKIDSDFYRAQRQHRVLKAIQEKLRSLTPEDYPALVEALFANTVETSLSIEDAKKLMDMGLLDYEITTAVIPDPDYETDVIGGEDENNVWVFQYDTAKAGERLRSIIGEE